MVAILAAFAIGFIIGAIVGVAYGIYIATRNNKPSSSTSTLNKVVLIILVIALASVVGITLISPDTISDPDTPSEIQCEPPLKNYNSVCSCGPEKELRKQPGGEMICAPMNT